MFLARVKGTVVATVKHATLQGGRFLLVQRMEPDGAWLTSRTWWSIGRARRPVPR